MASKKPGVVGKEQGSENNYEIRKATGLTSKRSAVMRTHSFCGRKFQGQSFDEAPV